MIKSEVLAAIESEYLNRMQNHGSRYRGVADWILIIEAELAEAKQAWLANPNDQMALRELVQVAASAVACLEEHGVGDGPKPDELPF